MSVRDIYEKRTVRNLAKILEVGNGESTTKGPIPPPSQSHTGLVFTTILQSVFLFLSLILVTYVQYGIVYVALPMLIDVLDELVVLVLLPWMFAALLLIRLPLSVLLAVMVKWCLIGKYKPGRHNVWGSMYLSHWISSQFVQLIPWETIQGTEFQSMVYRALGAKVGRDVCLGNPLSGGWDLVTIGDEVTFERDSLLKPISFANKEMILERCELRDGVNLQV